MQIPCPLSVFPPKQDEKQQQQCVKIWIAPLVSRCAGRVCEGNQLADGILFLGKRNLRLRVEDSEHISAVNSAQKQAVALNAYNSIFFVEY